MRRREFITLLGGTAAWPLAARAQQSERVRRIGVLLPATADDSEYQAWVGAFPQGLGQLGWTIGRNVRIDTRWATANAAEIRRHAAELATLAPDVILAHGDSTVGAMLQATRTVPIVFPIVADPVGAGYVDSLARPGGPELSFPRTWKGPCPPHHASRCLAGRCAVAVDDGLRVPRRPHPNARLRADARGRDGGIRQELAAGIDACRAERPRRSHPPKTQKRDNGSDTTWISAASEEGMTFGLCQVPSNTP
jgi:hypothetical protein